MSYSITALGRTDNDRPSSQGAPTSETRKPQLPQVDKVLGWRSEQDTENIEENVCPSPRGLCEPSGGGNDLENWQ